jgi:hypothetical protein
MTIRPDGQRYGVPKEAYPSPIGAQQSFSEIRMIVTASLTKVAYDDLLATLGVV